jgi:sec-independent protein translocase protein TatC
MDDTPRPLTEHLEELRTRLFWALGTLALAALACGWFARDVFEILMLPAVSVVRAHGHTLVAISPPELFFTYVKSAILGGFLISLPMTLYQVWAFVAPGLYEHEKRFAIPFVLSTTVLFLSGCAFGYFFAFPYVFEFFIGLEQDFVRSTWSTREIFGFMARMYLAFGVAFQLPVAMVILCIAGVTSPEVLARHRRYAIVIAFVVSAVLTPPDVASQILLAIPLLLLYEAGIWVARLLIRRRTATSVPQPSPTSAPSP